MMWGEEERRQQVTIPKRVAICGPLTSWRDFEWWFDVENIHTWYMWYMYVNIKWFYFLLIFFSPVVMKTMGRSPKAKTRIQFSKNLLFFGHFLFDGTATNSILFGWQICKRLDWVYSEQITDWPTRWSWNVWRDQQGSDRESQLTKRTASVWPTLD